ncbi:hypothetical protein BH09PSE3_BH09PSE3_04870 [soil metagenome]
MGWLIASRWLALGLLVSTAGHAKDVAPPIGPTEAIAKIDASRVGHGAYAGRFEMKVLATGHVGGSVFLNSSTDYRAPDDLSLRLLPNVVAAFTKRFGQSPETYFIGKHVVVDGTIKRELIVNTDRYFHRVKSLNRWQHSIQIVFANQLISVD